MKDKEYKKFRISHGKSHVVEIFFMGLFSFLLVFIVILQSTTIVNENVFEINSSY